MELDNGMQLEINKTWYNKTHVQEDGITHIIDTDHQYTAYQFGMAKNYFDIEEKPAVVREIIKDLRSTIQQLEKVLEKEEREQDGTDKHEGSR